MSRTWDALRKSERYVDVPLIKVPAEPAKAGKGSEVAAQTTNERYTGNPRLIRTAEEAIIKIAAEAIQLGPDAEVLVDREPESVLADRLRFLRTHLRSLWNPDKLKSLLVTSPFPQDGKSTVALNLATVLSEHGKRRVLLIEGDLHHPTVTQRLGLEYRQLPGLANCLSGEMEPFSAIRWIEPIEIYLLPAGKSSILPTELLQSDALLVMMQSLRENFDWVVVDSPPVKPLSDALLLRQRTDATLLVVRAGRTPGTAIDDAVEVLGKKNILGMVLNGVEGLDRTYSRYYGAYGGAKKK